MRPTHARIDTFKLYPSRGEKRQPYAHVKVLIAPDLVPGGPPSNSLLTEAIVTFDPKNHTVADINKSAAASIHASIQSAARLSLADIERAVEHALEYDEQRAD